MDNRSGFIDFDIVAPLETSVKYLDVVNQLKESDEYEVFQETPRNPLTYRFHIEPKKAVVKAGDKYTFKLFYTALVPSTTIFAYFNITSTQGICLKFGMKATCKGPDVQVSQKTLVFEQSLSAPSKVNTVELINTSEVTALYQFDVGETQSIFKLDKVFGTICPQKHTYVKISFHPPGSGVYSKTIFCLFLHQPPIVLQMIGKCSGCSCNCQVEFIEYPLPELITGGFQCYMHDVVNVVRTKPTLSLSRTCLQFEHVILDNDTSVPCSFTVTNHLPLDVVLKWIRNENRIFEICPPEVTIKSNKAELFCAYFKPKKQNLFYSAQLDAQVYWGKMLTEVCEQYSYSTVKYDAEVPLHLSMKLVGDTFCQFTYGWIPQYQIIPTDVALPACIPGESVWTTFVIHRYGCMPLMFKFIPPEQSCYIVKPMLGIIEDDFQIIVVGITPDKEYKSNYLERWTVRFNGNSRNEECVNFRAYVEIPNLQIGKENIVYFPPVFPRCEESVRVTIKNVTEHMIRFRFLRSSCPYLSITDSWNDISPNEIQYSIWKFTPAKEGNHTIEVLYEMYALEQGLFPVGQPTTIPVSVCEYCEHVDLVALPDSVMFGPSTIGRPKVKSIYIYNFGLCHIHFTLKALYSSFINRLHIVKEVVFCPDSGTINPGERKTITVYICPYERGFNEFFVIYEVRLNSDSETVVHISNKTLLNITYCGILPILKIEDMIILSGEQMLCKLWVWKLFNIDRLNYALATMKPSTERKVQLMLPDAIVGAEPLILELVLKNPCEISCQWSLKRKKNCDCKPIIKTKGFSFRVKDYRCPHVLMFTITPTEKKVKPEKEYNLQITVNYILEGFWEFIYILELPQNRTIELQAGVTIHSPLEKTVSYLCPNLEMEMKGVALGDRDPAAQVLWLYNFTDEYRIYDLDSSNISYLNNLNSGVTVLKCCNPFGCLAPRTTHAVIFYFKPLEIKHYKIFCTLRLGRERKMLAISAVGIKHFQNHLPSLLQEMPDVTKFRTGESLIIASLNYISTNPVFTHSMVERVFFIKNSSNYTLHLKWNRYCIINVLHAAVVPQNAVMKPGKSHSFKLIINTYSQPCLLTFQISCAVRDVYRLCHIQHSNETHVEGDDSDQAKEKTDEDIFMKTGTLQTNLAVACHIQSCVNVDLKMSLEDQMKQYPNKELVITKKERYMLKQHKDIITSTLEKIIWDILHGNRFRESLKHLQQEESPFYFQIPQNAMEYSLFKSDSFVNLSKEVLSEILEKLIYESLLHFRKSMQKGIHMK